MICRQIREKKWSKVMMRCNYQYKMKTISNKYKRRLQNSPNHLRSLNAKRSFNNHYSIAEKPRPYEALEDPHARYFFANESVRHHLKYLKKAIKKQYKSVKELSLADLINQKLKERYEDFLNPQRLILKSQLSQVNCFQKQSLSKLSRSLTQNTQGRTFFKTIKKQQKSINLSIHPECSEVKQRSEVFRQPTFLKSSPWVTKHSRYANRLFDQLHYKKHQKWNGFLEEKINSLSKNHEKKQIATTIV